MKTSVALASLLVLVSSCICFAQPPEVSGFQISWYDEFDGSELDESKWTPIFSINPTNFSLHAYLPSNLAVSGGNLIIISNDDPFGENFDYRSGQVISKTEHRYGRFEVRGNLPTSTGMWPAIWLNPDQPPLWPSQGEIDIMENRGNEPLTTSSAFHWGTNPPFVHNFVYDEFQIVKNGIPVNFHDSFHTYAVEWDPEQIRYYVDGLHYYTVRNSGVENFLTTAQTNPMRLIINTAIGGNFLPNPDETTQWPQFFEVDYVYVYDRVGDPVLRLENGDFETNNGSLSNWSWFGSNGNNISSDNSNVHSGDSALKMFGQFFGSQNFSGVEQGVSVVQGDQLRVSAKALVDSADSLAGTGNEAFLKIDYYSELYGVFNSSDYISSQQILLADASTPNDQWLDRQFVSTAPNGAVEARVALVFRQVNNASGAVFVDDVKFENLTGSENLFADSVAVLNGANVSGQLADLESSDDNYYRVLAGKISTADDPPVQIVVESTTAFADPFSIVFEVEGAANTPNIELKIEAFNFTTGQYDEVVAEPVGVVDGVTTTTLTTEPARYVNDADGKLLYRLSYSPTAPTLFFPWAVDLDQVRWTVER